MVPGPTPAAGSRLAGERVGRGDEGIGAVVDIEHRPLRALEEDALALLPGAVEPVPDRRREGQQAGCDRQQGLLELGGVGIRYPEAAPKRVVMEQQLAEPGPQGLDVAQIAETDGAAADLVLVGRADAAAGRADLGAAAGLLPRLVELAVDRQDQADVLGDRQRLRTDADALPRHGVDFVQQRPGIDHHAVADHGELAAAHHAGGQQAQLVLDAIHHQRVAGIVAALKAHHDVGPAGEPVDDLALALVAPLGAHHRDVAHDYSSPLMALAVPSCHRWLQSSRAASAAGSPSGARPAMVTQPSSRRPAPMARGVPCGR